MISVLLNRNNFIKNLLTAKSYDFKSLFVSAKHSRPYITGSEVALHCVKAHRQSQWRSPNFNPL